MMQENQPKKLTKKDIKERVVGGWRAFARFFKEFKWDKAHVSVLIKYAVEILLFAFIITFDLCMKDFLYEFVEVKNGGNITVIDGFLDLTYSENTGMGFGLGQNSTLGITIMTAILIVAILGYLIFFKKEKAYIRIPLIMVAAGGIGNLVDRTQLGYVRDFFEFTFMDFAIFNIADVFVTVGAIVLILGLIITLVFPSKDKRIPDDEKESGDVQGEQGETASEESMQAETASEETAREENGVSVTRPAEEGTEGAERASFTVEVTREDKKPFTISEVKEDGTDESEGE